MDILDGLGCSDLLDDLYALRKLSSRRSLICDEVKNLTMEMASVAMCTFLAEFPVPQDVLGVLVGWRGATLRCFQADAGLCRVHVEAADRP